MPFKFHKPALAITAAVLFTLFITATKAHNINEHQGTCSTDCSQCVSKCKSECENLTPAKYTCDYICEKIDIQCQFDCYPKVPDNLCHKSCESQYKRFGDGDSRWNKVCQNM